MQGRALTLACHCTNREDCAIGANGKAIECIVNADTLVLTEWNREVTQCAEKLRKFRRENSGYRYLQYIPQTPGDRLLPEDLAVTLAFNSRAGGVAFQSLVERGRSIDLTPFPDTPLHLSDPDMRSAVAECIAEVASWPGFGISLATKTLHKKRPNLIPVLDNQAIFEAYLDSRWPARRAPSQSAYGSVKASAAIDRVFADLTREENQNSWQQLSAVDPMLTRIEVLDMVWWMHFREWQPVARAR
jgi:hypothetical protein